MLATITIVTTANRHRVFAQNDRPAFEDLCAGLQRYQQIFQRKTLILASSGETEVFLPASLTRIEIQTGEDLGQYLPGTPDSVVKAIDPGLPVIGQSAAPGFFSGRVDFFFQGGDSLATWVEGPLASNLVDRIANYNNMFNQGVVTYLPQAGGIGFMNPAMMTRVVVHAGAHLVPNDAWRAEPLENS